MVSTMNDIINSLNDLHSTTTENVALDVLEDLPDVIKNFERNDFDPEQLVVAVFPADGGVVDYIKGHLGIKEHSKAKKQSFLVLQSLLQTTSFRKSVEKYLWSIYNIASIAWDNQREASVVQQEALNCLLLVLERFPDIQNDSRVELSKLYLRLLVSSNKSSSTPTVKGKIYECLGLISSFGENTFLGEESKYFQLLRLYTTTIQSQVEAINQHVEATILQGCIKGLDKFLCNYGTQISVKSKEVQQFYQNLEQIVDPKCSIKNDAATAKLKRREFQRCGLDFIANHGEYFAEDLFENHKYWFDDLLAWATSQNAADMKAGEAAMTTFLKCTSSFAQTHSNVDVWKERIKNYNQFLAAAYSEVMCNVETKKAALSIALRGIGCLACTCEMLLLEPLFFKMMQRVEAVVNELNVPSTDVYIESRSLIPAYLEGSGNVLRWLKYTDDEHKNVLEQKLSTLAQLTVLLVTSYPDLKGRDKAQAPSSLLVVFNGIRAQYSFYYKQFVDQVLQESLTHIISLPTQMEADMISACNQTSTHSQGGNRRVYYRTVKSFTTLWLQLIRLEASALDFQQAGETVLDLVLEWFLNTITKLDLTLEDVEEDNDANDQVVGDPIYTTKPTVPKDFQLFVNIADFLTDVLGTLNSEIFQNWVESFLDAMLNFIQSNPLVSGFYKIAAITFRHMKDLRIFKDQKHAALLDRCSVFLKQLSMKTHEFRDDLLIAALQIWLSVPDELVMLNIFSLGETLLIAFRAGQLNFNIALSGINAVDRWFNIPNFPVDEKQRIVNKLFQTWLNYFSSDEEKEENILSKVLGMKSLSKSQKIRMEAAIDSELRDASLKKVQRELLLLIGTYGHLLYMTNDNEETGFSTAGRCMKYAVPFQDINPEIYLDVFVPQLIEVCKKSSDRQRRTTACEIFHTLILYFTGQLSKYTTGSAEQDVWRQVFSSLLALGADSDIVVRQLFNPLAVQTIHWCTKAENPVCDLSLQLIIDGLVQYDDASMRDFCCVCLQEFLTWCLKHKNYKKSGKLLDYLVSLSQHASPQYRQGAILGFNSIYSIFREPISGQTTQLYDKYTFLLLHSCVMSLHLSEDFEESSMLIRTTKKAILHLERIIIKKRDSFNVVIDGRLMPQVIAKHGKTLRNVVEWLFDTSAETKSLICQEECFRLINTLAPHLKDTRTVEAFFNSRELNLGKDSFIQTAEIYMDTGESDNIFQLVTGLEKASHVYAFLKSSNYAVETLFDPDGSSKFVNGFIKFLRVLQKYKVQQGLSEECLKIFRVIKNISVLSHILPPNLQAFLIEASAAIARKLVDKRIDISKEGKILPATWKKLWSNCIASGETVSYAPKIKQVLKLESIECVENPEIINWMHTVVESEFPNGLYSVDELSFITKSLLNLVDVNLFENKDGEIQEKFLSGKLRKTLERLFSLAIHLRAQDEYIVEKVLDPVRICKYRSEDKTTRGEIYQKYFTACLPSCPKLLQFYELLEKFSIEKVGDLVVKLLTAVKSKKHLRLKFGETLVKQTVRIWKQLTLNCTKPAVSELINGMASLHMNACRNSEELASWWCGSGLMNDDNLTFREKSDFVHFFGLFGLSTNKSVVDTLVTTLRSLLERNLSGTRIRWEGDSIYVLKILHTVLQVFGEVPSQSVFQLVCFIVAKAAIISGNDSNLCGINAKKKMEEIAAKVDFNVQYNLADAAYSMIFSNEGDHECYAETLAVSKYLLLPLLTSSNEQATKTFFKKHVNGIVSHTIAVPGTSKRKWNLRLIAFNLTEILCLLESDAGIFFTSPELNNVYLQGQPPKKNDSKDCARDIMKACSMLTDVTVFREQSMQKLVYECNQAAFNVMHAGVRVMHTPPNVVFQLAVQMNSKSTAKWGNIIDCNQDYEFPVVFDKPSVEEAPKSSFAPEPVSRSSKLDALIGSSLSVEAYKYDFTASVTVEKSRFYREIFDGVQPKSTRSSTVTLEWSFINEHPCMLPFVETIRNLDIQKNQEVKGEKKYINIVRDLANYMRMELQKTSVHQNIKAFFTRAIMNCKLIFEPYGYLLMNPLVESISSLCFGADLNYFVKDLLVLLLEWDGNAKPAPTPIQKLLEFIVPNVKYEGTDNKESVLKQNLQILTTVVEKWVTNSSVDMPFQVIQKLVEEGPTGLRICKSILLAGHIPCQRNGEFNLNRLVSAAGRSFTSNTKSTYTVGAQVLGLILRELCKNASGVLPSVTDSARKYVDGVRNRPQVFIAVLKVIQELHPSFLVLYKPAVLEMMKGRTPKIDTLKMISMVVRMELEDATGRERPILSAWYTELLGRGLFQYMCKNEEETRISVEILGHFLEPEWTEDIKQISTFIDWKINAEKSENSRSRLRYAQLLSKIFFRFEFMNWVKSGTFNRSKDEALTNKIQKLFVRLQNDKDESVRDVVNQFWERNAKNWGDSPNLMLELMEAFAGEQDSIRICLELIMKRCSLAPVFSKQIYDKDLGECQFQAYNVDTSWRGRLSTLLPFYAESLSSSQVLSQLPGRLQSAVLSQRMSSGRFGLNMLRSTLKAGGVFTPTGPGITADSAGVVVAGNSFTQHRFYQDFRGNVTEQLEASKPVTDGALARLRTRFYKKSSDFFVERELEKQKDDVEQKIDAIKTQRSGVTLMRSYRIGDLPDIRMSHSDFINSALAMSQVDEEMGRALLVQLFTSMITEVSQKSLVATKEFQRKCAKIFGEVLENSGAYVRPQFAASVVEISLRNDIIMRPSLLAATCQNFCLHQLALLKLENDLQNIQQKSIEIRQPENKKTRMAFQVSGSECDILLSMAELYKDIDDYDSVRNIFSMAAAIEGNEIYNKSSEALKLERMGKHTDALVILGELSVDDVSMDDLADKRMQYREASIYKCLKELSNWDGVFERCENNYEDLSDALQDIEYLDKILPHQLGAASQIVIRNIPENNPEIWDRVQEYLKCIREKDDLWDQLVSDFIDIPVVSAIWNIEIGYTSAWMDKSLNKSIQNFSYLRKYFTPQRNDEILKVQRAAMLQDYLLCSKVSNDHKQLEELSWNTALKWRNSGKPVPINTVGFDILTRQRDALLTSMAMAIDETMLENKDLIVREMQTTNFQQYLWLIEVSITQRNSAIAFEAFRKAKEVGQTLDDESKLQWQRLRCLYLNTFNNSADAAPWNKMWISCWKDLRKIRRIDSGETYFCELQADLLKALLLSLSRSPISDTISSVLPKNVGEDSSQCLRRISVELGRKVATEMGEQLGITPVASEMHLKLYNLLKYIFKTNTVEGSLHLENDIEQIMLESLLRAMYTGNVDALHLFPAAFHTVERHPNLVGLLQKHIVSIPSWMYLPWLDQIVVNFKHNTVLKEPLGIAIKRILDDYPQVFQLQYKDVLPRGTRLPELYTVYQQALEAVTLPSVLVKEFLLSKQPSTQAEMEAAIELCVNKLKEMKDNPFYGSLHQNYIAKFLPPLQTKLAGLKNLSQSSESCHNSSTSTSNPGLSENVKSLWREVQSAFKLSSDSVEGKSQVRHLESLSPWLAKYRSCDYDIYLEIPGVYDKFEKPNVETHPKITALHKNVPQLVSLTKPLRVAMVCNNGKSIRYLVKRGDDLRQDKRIQQCFHVANRIFKTDQNCRDRRLQIKTYAIIPLTPSFGLIEWVDETQSVKSMILQPANKDMAPKLENIQRETQTSYLQWINPLKQSHTQDPSLYHKNAMNVGRQEAVQQFDHLVYRFPGNLFRDQVMQGCGSLEHYFIVRTRMIRSYATMSFIHWILGIGDRHLENNTVCTQTGEFLGIDFGRSFGITVFKMPVPELVPFRLTPQIQNFLLPYGHNGLLKETMICAKSGISQLSYLLMSVADIFIREPIVDWLQARKRGEEGERENPTNVEIPLEITNILKQKLEGKNPFATMVETIQLQDTEKMRNVYTRLIKDGRSALASKSELSDEEYVDVLLELATDRNLLIRHYIGWCCWL